MLKRKVLETVLSFGDESFTVQDVRDQLDEEGYVSFKEMAKMLSAMEFEGIVNSHWVGTHFEYQLLEN
jgi:hypothetical protein